MVGSSGKIASRSLKLARFIFGVTGYAVMSSAGNGGKMVMPVGCAGNQVFSRPRGKITGIRSWIGGMPEIGTRNSILLPDSSREFFPIMLVDADVDDSRRVRKADETRKLRSGDCGD